MMSPAELPTTANVHHEVRPHDVVLLAGQRPGNDPLASHFGLTLKALLEVDGQSMLARMLGVLTAAPGVRTIHVLAQHQDWLADHMGPEWCAAHPDVHFQTCGPSISGAIMDVIKAGDARLPLLVTTADNVLLNQEILHSFVPVAANAGADVAFGLVERQTMIAAYPGNRRTWLKFRGGAYSGANLFWFGTDRARVVLNLWRTIEQDRKKGRAVIGAFGLPLLIGAGLRILSLHQGLRLAGRKIGVTARAVMLPQAEAAIDVDKVSDHVQATEILRHRAQSQS